MKRMAAYGCILIRDGCIWMHRDVYGCKQISYIYICIQYTYIYTNRYPICHIQHGNISIRYSPPQCFRLHTFHLRLRMPIYNRCIQISTLQRKASVSLKKLSELLMLSVRLDCIICTNICACLYMYI